MWRWCDVFAFFAPLMLAIDDIRFSSLGVWVGDWGTRAGWMRARGYIYCCKHTYCGFFHVLCCDHGGYTQDFFFCRQCDADNGNGVQRRFFPVTIIFIQTSHEAHCEICPILLSCQASQRGMVSITKE